VAVSEVFIESVDMNDSNNSESQFQVPNDSALLTKVYKTEPSPEEIVQDYEGLLSILCDAIKDHRENYKPEKPRKIEIELFNEICNKPKYVSAIRSAITNPKESAYRSAIRDVGRGLCAIGGTDLMRDVSYRVSDRNQWAYFDIVCDHCWNGVGRDNDIWCT
jgi:hypothetical protein